MVGVYAITSLDGLRRIAVLRSPNGKFYVFEELHMLEDDGEMHWRICGQHQPGFQSLLFAKEGARRLARDLFW